MDIKVKDETLTVAPLRALIIEDNQDDAELLVRKLRSGGFDLAYKRVDTAEAMYDALGSKQWDIVLSDYSLPQFSGAAALQVLSDSGLDIPFIVISGTIGEEAAVEMMRAGANDYLFKDKLLRLSETIKRELREAKTRREVKLSRIQLAFNEKRLRSIIENSSDVISLIDAKGIIKYSSPSITRILGYQDHEHEGHSIFENIHPDDLPRTTNVFKELLKENGHQVSDVIRYRHSDGHWLWMEGVAKNLLAEPSVQAIVVNYRDITDRKLTEDVLIMREQSLSVFMDNFPGMVYRCLNDRDWTLQFTNSGALTLTGYTPAQFTSGKIKNNDIIHPDDRERIWDAVQEAIEQQQNFQFEYRIRTADGKEKWVWEQGCGIFNDAGELQVLEGFITDITPRVQAREKQRLLASIIGQTDDAVMVTDPEGVIEYVNPAFERITGYSSTEATGQNMSLIKSDMHDSGFYADLWETIKGGESFQEIFISRRKDGEIFYEQKTITPLMDEQGIITHYVSTAKDITERKRSEERLELLTFALNHSHESAYLIDENANFQEVNDEACRSLGYTRGELLNMNVLDIDPIITKEKLQSNFNESTLKGMINIETVYRRKDGTTFPVEVYDTDFKYEGKQYHLALVRDITERKLANEKLRESEGKLKEAQQMTHLGNWYWDVKTGECKWSDEVYKIFGLDPEEFTPQIDSIMALSPWPEDSQRHNQVLANAIENREQGSFEQRFLRPDGSTGHYFSTFKGIYDLNGDVIAMQGTIQDITERKQTEQNIALLNFALSHAGEAFYLLNVNADFLDVNVEACRVLNYTREELLDMKLIEINPDFSMKQWHKFLIEIKQKGSFITETRHQRKDGRIFAVEVNASYFEYNGQGYVIRLVRDITERNLGQDKILRLNRVYKMMSAINTLIVHVHDRQVLLNEACRIAVEDGQFRMTWIGFLQAGENVVVPQAWAGHEDGYLQHIHISMEEDSVGKDSATSQALRVMQPVIYNNFAEVEVDIPWKEAALSRGYNAVAGLPLIVDGKVIGVMSLYAAVKDFFDEEEMKLLTELASDISYALQNIAQEEKLDYLASYDSLTGLANRTQFHEHLNSVLERAGQNKKKVALLVCDLRQFRRINSVYGPETGDRVLQETARRLRELTDDPVNIARIASDYFVMILHDVGDATGIGHLFEHTLFPALNQSLLINDQEIQLNLCGGIAVYPVDGQDAEQLYRNAEAALKKAKLSNEPYLFYQPEMTARIAETIQIENKLRYALQAGQYVLHYQPKIEARTRKITGLEALIRWNDPETGLVPPLKFIPILEETGLILEVGLWALDRAASDYRQWQKEFKTVPRIAVNVSAVQLHQKDFVAQVQQAICRSGIAVPLDIELTESLVMTDIALNISKLKALQLAGLGIAIDDFGTGYSSLSYIAKLPIDALKIDRSFIKNMTAQADSMSIVSAIITLAHALKFKVIAEGVETEEQAKFLTLLKCDEMQGFLFSKPLPAAEIFELLRSGKTM